MPSWNIDPETKMKTMLVQKILNRRPDFMVVQMSNGKQQKLCDANLPDWQLVREGSELKLTTQRTVVGAKIVRTKLSVRSVEGFIQDLERNGQGLFYIIYCPFCDIMECVPYDEGDASFVIAEHINQAHQKNALPRCDKSKIRLFDNRSIEITDKALITAIQKMP